MINYAGYIQNERHIFVHIYAKFEIKTSYNAINRIELTIRVSFKEPKKVLPMFTQYDSCVTVVSAAYGKIRGGLRILNKLLQDIF